MTRDDKMNSLTKTTLGVDVGGTFTDLALWDGERVVVGKLSSTTDDQSRGVIDGTQQILGPGRMADLLHGTTVATNALLERRGANTLLITDTGFESVIEIARQDRPSLYDPLADRASPLARPEMRVGVQLGADTSEDQLDTIAAEIAEIADRLRVEAIAICLLYSYADPEPERRLRRRLQQPDLALKMPISVSSEVVAEFREYERMSTTVINAFLSPEVARYMENLEKTASGSGLVTNISVMRSSGGLISVDHAGCFPSSILLSGPAGGVVATAALGEEMGHETLISFDMGGTSSDVCRVERGRPEVTYNRKIDGLTCLMPSVAVHTVGAGGGSIAWVDDGGALRVGPRSAGAEPGPACYDRGGTEPTVTDANLVLGRLDPDAKLAGTVELRRDLALAAFARLGESIDLDATDIALGVIKVVESLMTHAIRTVSVEQGTDPRNAVLVAFGGAGGLHATALARSLDMKGVIIPPFAGVFSAYGLLLSPPRSDLALTVNLNGAAFDELRERARDLRDQASAGVERDSGIAAAERSAIIDMRYKGQAHETSVPYVDDDTWPSLCDRFHDLHEQRNGFSRPGDEVEAVTIRAEAVGSAALAWSDLPAFVPTAVEDRRRRRELITASGSIDVDVVSRSGLPPGQALDGPAIIEAGESTIHLADGEHAVVHATGALEVSW